MTWLYVGFVFFLTAELHVLYPENGATGVQFALNSGFPPHLRLRARFYQKPNADQIRGQY